MRVAYLSYDGALDPLGATQVVPYLEGLSGTGVQFQLITFEKPSRLADPVRVSTMSARFMRAGIVWHPLQYHRWPRVPATLLDIANGARLLRGLGRDSPFDLVHCRGEITPTMVRLSGSDAPLLLDMRGFFSDERVEAGSWPAGGIVDRAVRRVERGNLRRASRLVVLTERGRVVLKERGVEHPIDVIPTAVDCNHFTRATTLGAARYDLVYFGSLGGWYMTEAMLDFVDELRGTGEALRVLFLTNNVDETLSRRLREAKIDIESTSPEDVPERLSACRCAFFFIRATSSKRASCPTKLAEALAMGLPVLTGPGVGDVDSIVREGGVGVILEDFSSSSYVRGWKEMRALLEDPATPGRCRAVAEHRLSLVTAVNKYREIYGQLEGSRR